MKRMVIALAVLACSGAAVAQASHYVQGYTRSDGTYVAGHYATNPDSTTTNNWSTRGNVNPYTGQEGTRNPAPANTNPYAPKPRTTPQPCYYNCPH